MCPEILLIPQKDLISVTNMLKDVLEVDIAPLLLERPVFLTKQRRMDLLWKSLREEFGDLVTLRLRTIPSLEPW